MAGRGPDGRDDRPAPKKDATDHDRHRSTIRAVLELSGQVGYDNVTVAAILDRSGSNRARFYATFGGKHEAYAIAYTEVIGELVDRLLRACAARDWTSGLKASLLELASFVDEDRDVAAGLIAEVHVAGGRALVVRNEVVERLSRAVDRARREIPGSRNSPPLITAQFIVDGIESTVVRTLVHEGSLRKELPGFLYLAVAFYFGNATAQRAEQDLRSSG